MTDSKLMTWKEAIAMQKVIDNQLDAEIEAGLNAEADYQRELYNDWLPYVAPRTEAQYWETVVSDDG